MVLLRNFSPCFPIKRNIKAGFNRKANLVACYLPILSILRRRQAITSTKQLTKILASPKDVFGEATKIQHHFQNLIERIFSFSDIAHSCCEHCFPASAAPRPNISPIMEVPSDDFWDSLQSSFRTWFRLSQSSKNVPIWSLQNLYDLPDRLYITQFYPNNRGCPNRPGRLRLSG